MKAGSSSSTRKQSPLSGTFALNERNSSIQSPKASLASLTSQRKLLVGPYSDLHDNLSLHSFGLPSSFLSSHHFSTLASVPVNVRVKKKPLTHKVKFMPVPVWEVGYMHTRPLYAEVDSALNRFSREQNDHTTLLKSHYEISIEAKSRLAQKREVPKLKRSLHKRDPIVSIYSSCTSPISRSKLSSPESKTLVTSMTRPRSAKKLGLKLVGQAMNPRVKAHSTH
jgi:hypothetical protein